MSAALLAPWLCVLPVLSLLLWAFQLSAQGAVLYELHLDLRLRVSNVLTVLYSL